MDAIMSYPNVNVRNSDIVRYGEGTLLEDWIKSGKLYTSMYLKSHVSDYLRLLRYIYMRIKNNLNIIKLK